MQIDEAHHLLTSAHADFARFYGPVGELDFGVGLVLKGLAYPIYDEQEADFAVAIGRAYILSHECDIDQANARPLNTHVLLCPIIPLETLLNRYLVAKTEDQVRAFINALGRRVVDRATYIPTIADELPYGGVLYFSSITNTHVSELSKEGVISCCSLSAFGLRYVDWALHQAILKRPKAQPLPLTEQLMGGAFSEK